MGDSLASINNFIYTLSPENINIIDLNTMQIQSCIKYIKDAIEGLKEDLLLSYLNIKTPIDTISVVHSHQHSTISLINLISEYYITIVDKNVIDLYKEIQSILENLIDFLKSFFSDFFNINAELSIPEGLKQSNILAANLNNLNILANDYQIDADLLELFRLIINQFIQNINMNKLTYRKVDYFDRIFQDLTCALNNELSDDKTMIFVDVLHDLNFNHTRFSNYLKKKITIEVNQLDTPVQKANKMCYYLESLNQKDSHNPFLIFYPSLPTAKQRLSEWLKEQIKLQKRSKYPSFVTSTNDLDNKEPEALAEIIYSVPVIACFIKIIVERKIIKDFSIPQLSTKAAQFFRTTDTHSISPGSLINKCYAVSDETRKRVNDILYDIIKNNKKLKVNQ